MDKPELRKLIAECVEEVAMEEGWGSDLWNGVKKQFTGGKPTGPNAGGSHYDRFSQMHNKRADYNAAHDPKNTGNKVGGMQQSKMRVDSRNKVEKIKNKLEADLKQSMRDAFIEAESVGIKRLPVTTYFMDVMIKVFKDYKRLEEVEK